MVRGRVRDSSARWVSRRRLAAIFDLNHQDVEFTGSVGLERWKHVDIESLRRASDGGRFSHPGAETETKQADQRAEHVHTP